MPTFIQIQRWDGPFITINADHIVEMEDFSGYFTGDETKTERHGSMIRLVGGSSIPFRPSPYAIAMLAKTAHEPSPYSLPIIPSVAWSAAEQAEKDKWKDDD